MGGPLILLFSLKTPQENCKGIIPTLKALTTGGLTTGNVSGIIKDSLVFLVMANHGDLRTALWLSFLKEVITLFKLEYNKEKDVPSKCSKLLLPTSCGAVQTYYIKRAILPLEVILNFTCRVCSTRYPLLPWILVYRSQEIKLLLLSLFFTVTQFMRFSLWIHIETYFYYKWLLVLLLFSRLLNIQVKNKKVGMFESKCTNHMNTHLIYYVKYILTLLKKYQFSSFIQIH